MAYSKTTWVTGETPLSASNMNNIENGIVANETALGDKVDKVEGKGLSTNDYTTTEKTKLAGIAAGAETNIVTNVSIEYNDSLLIDSYGLSIAGIPGITSISVPKTQLATASKSGLMGAGAMTKLNGIATGAEVNQNAFSNVKVGSTTVAADSKTDTLELVAGTNVTLTPDATNDKVTIAATDTTYSEATTSAAGLMSATDKYKLNNIETGAEVNRSLSLKTYKLAANVTITGNGQELLIFKNTSSTGSYRAIVGISLITTSYFQAPVAIRSFYELTSSEMRVSVYNYTNSSETISKDDSYVEVLCIG